MSLEFFIDFNLVGKDQSDDIGRKYINTGFKRILKPFIRRSDKYNQCKAALVAEFSNHDEIDRPAPPYRVTIQSHQYADMDAYISLIFDALQGANVIDNDRNILGWGKGTGKTPIKRGGKESHYIRVEHYEAE